jgi:hypothetical protein
VTQVGTAPSFANTDEALEIARAALGYLAAADATQLGAAAQARCLRAIEQADAIATAARASFLAAFTAGQGYADDAAYSARAWLIHQTRITSGAAVGHAAWAKRVRIHPRVLAALAAGQVSESVGRLICLWTDRLPEHLRDQSDELLVAAAQAGLGSWPRWPRRCTKAPAPSYPMRTPTPHSRTAVSSWPRRSAALESFTGI